jgi:type IV secretory pathway TrbL component
MAGSRWTSRISEGALAYVVRVAVKLFVLYLIAGVANGLTVEWANRINSTEFIGPVSYLGFLGSAYALMLMVWSIPRYAASMVQPTLALGLTPAVGDN